jgi:hypothetical protein
MLPSGETPRCPGHSSRYALASGNLDSMLPNGETAPCCDRSSRRGPQLARRSPSGFRPSARPNEHTLTSQLSPFRWSCGQLPHGRGVGCAFVFKLFRIQRGFFDEDECWRNYAECRRERPGDHVGDICTNSRIVPLEHRERPILQRRARQPRPQLRSGRWCAAGPGANSGVEFTQNAGGLGVRLLSR